MPGAQLRHYSSTLRTREAILREHSTLTEEESRAAPPSSLPFSPSVLPRQLSVSPEFWIQQSVVFKSSLGESALKTSKSSWLVHLARPFG